MSGTSEILAAHRQMGHGNAVPVDQLFTRKELVGKGAYGGVYKGVHNPTGLVVALKVIDLDTPDDDITEIQKEVALLSEMRDAAKHNITLYHGCYLHGYELWIAMDFASGGSIRTLMKSGPIEEKYIVLILREVLVALSFLHRQGIIHRDVKAANILLTQTSRILLCDFGVAAHLPSSSNKRSTFIGTPLWMAPEVITDGKMYDTKADIWSLGVTAYEIATGNPPFFGMEPLRACALIPRTTPARLEGGTWSTGMKEWVAQCLQIDPVTRPTSQALSQHLWIRSSRKSSMSLLRDLIARYVGWIQSGGQRASLVMVGGGGGHEEEEEEMREDTFELGAAGDGGWDFGDEDLIEAEMIEPLGDEPQRAPNARTLDAQAAISQLRPPKAPTLPRNHPLMRLFDASSNPYAQSTNPSAIILPSGNNADTVRPTIALPSFEEEEEEDWKLAAQREVGGGAGFGGAGGYGGGGFGGASGTGGFGGASLSFGGASWGGMEQQDVQTPATLRPNPFSWTQQPTLDRLPPAQHLPPVLSAQHQLPYVEAPSPYTRAQSPEYDDSPWGSASFLSASASTPTNASFPEPSELYHPQPQPPQAFYAPQALSPQPSSVPLNASPSLPTMPASASSMNPLLASSTSSSTSAATVTGSYGRRRADTAPSSEYPPLGPGLPSYAPVPSSSSHSTTASVSSSGSTVATNGSGGSLYTSGSGSANSSFSSALTSSPPSVQRPWGSRSTSRQGQYDEGSTPNGGSVPNPYLNRPFRARQGSDAALNGGVGTGTARPFRMNGAQENRSRTGSDASGGVGGGNGPRPKHALKLQISTASGLPPSASTNPLSASTSSSSGSLTHSRTGSGVVGYSFPPPTERDQLHWTDPGFISGVLSTDPTTPLASLHSNAHSRSAGGGSGGGFPFPSAAARGQPTVDEEGAQDDGEIETDEEGEYEDVEEAEPWPAGPELRVLDYGKLKTAGDVHDELERTLGELGKWLEVVDGGLERILRGTQS